MQPVWANISNIFGRKLPLYICMGFFFVGSIVFATAQNMDAIIIGRALQGFGGGGMDVLAEVILADMTTLQERSKYMGLLGMIMAVGNISGSAVGALFATYASWRWIGWINLPLLGIGTPLVIFFLKLRPVHLDEPLAKKLNRLDWIGTALAVVGITVFALPLSWAGSLFPWRSWQTLVPMFVGLAVLSVFTFYEVKATDPMIPPRLFSSKTANATLAGGFIHGVVLFSLLQYLPLLFQAVSLESAISAAVCLLPTVTTSVIVAAVAMMLVPLFGGYTWILRVSWGITALGAGVLAIFDVDSPSSMRYGIPIVWGVGISLLRLNLLPMQASVKHVDDTGMAIGLFSTIRMFGALIGLTIASSIFNTVFAARLSATSVVLTGDLAPLRNASNSVAFIDHVRSLHIPDDQLHEVLEVYLQCFRTLFYTMTGFSGLGLITSIFQDEIDLKSQGQGSQRFEH